MCCYYPLTRSIHYIYMYFLARIVGFDVHQTCIFGTRTKRCRFGQCQNVSQINLYLFVFVVVVAAAEEAIIVEGHAGWLVLETYQNFLPR